MLQICAQVRWLAVVLFCHDLSCSCKSQALWKHGCSTSQSVCLAMNWCHNQTRWHFTVLASDTDQGPQSNEEALHSPCIWHWPEPKLRCGEGRMYIIMSTVTKDKVTHYHHHPNPQNPKRNKEEEEEEKEEEKEEEMSSVGFGVKVNTCLSWKWDSVVSFNQNDQCCALYSLLHSPFSRSCS